MGKSYELSLCPEGYGMAAVHTHSQFSLDGLDEPEGLVMVAAKAGFDVLVLTDHDTVEGVNRARREGNRVGFITPKAFRLKGFKF